jgi:hypothetical protein
MGLIGSTQACVVAVKDPFEKGVHLSWGDERGIDAQGQREIGLIEGAKNARAATTHTTYRAKIAQNLREALGALMTQEDESEEIPQK